MRPVSVAFFYSSFLFFCFRCRDRFRTVIGSISLNPSPRLPMPEIRDGLNSLPATPPPPPFLPAVFLVSTVLRLSARPRLFSSFCRDVLSTCLSVRLSVSVPCPRLCVPYNSVLLALFIIPFLFFSISSYRVYLYQMQRFSA